MSETAMGGARSLRGVLEEQIRAVGLAIRREAILAAVLLGGVLLLTLAVGLRVSESMDLDPAEGYGVVAGLVGLLFPLLVWKGERLFGDTQLWTLPVAHDRHALIKVGAGWAWLMTFTAIAMAAVALTVASLGGGLGTEEIRIVALDPLAARAGAVGATEPVTWSTPAWQWLLPFTSATVGYLAGSAVLVGTRHPFRWVAGVALLLFAVGLISEEGNIEWLNQAFESVLMVVFFLPLGLDTVATGGLEGLTTRAELPSGQMVEAWRSLPSLGRWASATLLWTGLGAAGLWAALLRHRERGKPQ